MRPHARSAPFALLLTNRPFAALWLGQAISNSGDVLYTVALLWAVLDQTNSAFAASLVAVATMFGRLGGGLIASVILDRHTPRLVMLASDLLRCLLTGGFGILWLRGLAPPLTLLYGLAALGALGGALFGPARAAALPQIVPSERRLAANALDKLASSLTDTLIFAGSGAIVAPLGPARCMILDAATFVVSFAAVYSARWESGRRPEQDATSWFSGLLDVLRWIMRHPLARTVLAAQLLQALASGIFYSAIAPHLRQQFANGATVYGVQGACFSVGLISGALLLSWQNPRQIGWLYACGIVINGLGNCGFALAPSLITLLPAVFIAGLGNAAFTTGEITLLQTYSPPALRGRIFALTITLGTAFVLPAIVLGGWLGDRIELRWLLLGGALGQITIGLLLLTNAPLRAIRPSSDR
jgi:MFS family permease